ncbi:MAG: hypothetical protein Kow00108_08770 [Calditrichia bacterium]
MAIKSLPHDSQSNELNFIGKGTYVEGQIVAESNLRIDGKVKGKVVTKNLLTIGANGEVDGEVEAKDAIVGGLVKGKVKISNKLELEAKAKVIGDVETQILVIEQGAVFHGNSIMQSGDKEKPVSAATEKK